MAKFVSKPNARTACGRSDPAGAGRATNKWLLWTGFVALILSTAHLLAMIDFTNWPVWLWRAKIYLRHGPGEAVPEAAGTRHWHLPPSNRA
ncbi:MAG TPA: hypothetical protein VHC39_03430 [Rhizomicrobium sp.]|nr:hypothetical protein [Rhizomicrobium sp.]